MRIAMILWEWCWTLFCAWTPKPLNRWRLLWLRLFGARIQGTPFVHQRVRIQIPWHVSLRDRCCLGDRANLYSLGRIEIEEDAIVAQEVYVCTGTHDFDHPERPLVTRDVRVGRGAFIGVRAMILPGVTIGAHAIIGACAVVTKDVEAWTINAGNPCRLVRRRTENTEAKESHRQDAKETAKEFRPASSP